MDIPGRYGRELTERFPARRRILFALLALMALGYFLLSDLMDGSLWAHEPWDSYSLQTYNWLRGRTYIPDGADYDFLELAIYRGRYYVSFPPLPSVVLIPLVAVFGLYTPDNLLMAVYGLIAADLAYRIMLKAGRTPLVSAFWALVCVWGCNMLWLTTNAGVWFQAQALNFVLCLAAALCAQYGRKALSTTFLALAVGCRPLSAVFLPVFALTFAWNERAERGGFLKSCLAQWRCLIGPILIGACYMVYNYVRFDDPLEFGHNYLPEFVAAEHGQFHWSYLARNLRQMFLAPVLFWDGRLQFPIYQGFMFYVANPLFILYFLCLLRHVTRREAGLEDALTAAGIALVLALTCLHRTLGAWQFGSRYSCDTIPFAYLYLARRGRQRPALWEIVLGCAAVAFNAYGALYMYFYG